MVGGVGQQRDVARALDFARDLASGPWRSSPVLRRGSMLDRDRRAASSACPHPCSRSSSTSWGVKTGARRRREDRRRVRSSIWGTRSPLVVVGPGVTRCGSGSGIGAGAAAGCWDRRRFGGSGRRPSQRPAAGRPGVSVGGINGVGATAASGSVVMSSLLALVRSSCPTARDSPTTRREDHLRPRRPTRPPPEPPLSQSPSPSPPPPRLPSICISRAMTSVMYRVLPSRSSHCRVCNRPST